MPNEQNDLQANKPTLSVTEQLLQKYPEHLVEYVRQNLDLEKDDTSMDSAILSMERATFLSRVLSWNGFIAYGYTIRDWVGAAYGIELGNDGVTFQDPEKGWVDYRG